MFVALKLRSIPRAQCFCFGQLGGGARQILRSAGKRSLGLRELRLGGDSGRGIVGLRNAHRRTLRIQLRHRLVVLCLGLGIRNLLLAGIEVDQRLPGFHHLVVGYIHRGRGARDPRAHHVQMSIHLRVIG